MSIRGARQGGMILVGSLLVAIVATAQKHVILTRQSEGMDGIEWIDLVETNGAGIETNGVSLSLWTDNVRYRAHEPVVLNVSLKNTGQSAIAVTQSRGLISFKDIYVLHPAFGGRSKQTAYSTGPDYSTFDIRNVGINSGEERRDSYEINRLFDMTLSGEYRIFVRKEVTLFNPERRLLVQTPAIAIRIDDRQSDLPP